MIPGVVAGGGFWEAGTGDPFFANVVSLLHFDGADNDTTFTDVIGKVWTPNGDAKISTAQAMWGGASGLFDGAGDWLDVGAASADFNFSGDCTIEFWMRPANVAAVQAIFEIYQTAGDSSNRYNLTIASGALLLFSQTPGVVISGGSLSDDTWYFVALTKASGTWRLFLNGVLLGSVSSSGFPTGNLRCAIARPNGGATGGGFDYAGYLDDMRFTKGVARYTANFTPPAGPFPNV